MATLPALSTEPKPVPLGDEPEPKPVPLGDEPEDQSARSAGGAEGAVDPPPPGGTGKGSQLFADRDNEEGIPTVRGVFAFGGQLALASNRLEPATGPAGGGGRLSLGFAPATWPVLFGVSLDLVSYGSTTVTYEGYGTAEKSKVELLSHMGQVLVRLQPERYVLRPFIEVTGGYWVLPYNQKFPSKNKNDNDEIKTLRAAATGCWGVGVGLDWLFGIGPRLGNFGIGFDVRYTRGIGLPMADLSTATAEDGELSIPGKTTIKGPSQLLFTLSFVVASYKGNWATSTPRSVRK